MSTPNKSKFSFLLRPASEEKAPPPPKGLLSKLLTDPEELETPEEEWLLPAFLWSVVEPPPEDPLRKLSRLNGTGGPVDSAEARLVCSKVLRPLGLEMFRLMTWRDEAGEHWVAEPGAAVAEEADRQTLRNEIRLLWGAASIPSRKEALAKWAKLPWEDHYWD